MKQYLGNYLGLCINNNDPERRGRVQIFIPHIMPALFKDWNEAGEDIQLLCVGDNLPQSLPSYIVEKLTKMLPWAEGASPILGTSSPGTLQGTQFNQSPIVGAVTAEGGGTINNAERGGDGGNWGGSLDKMSQILPVGTWNPTSQKRDRTSTASGGVSDHYTGNTNAYGVDLGLSTSFGGDSAKATQTAIQIVNNVRAQRGEPLITSWDTFRGNKYEAVTPDGYRVQVIWQSQVGGNHNDHIHIGVANQGNRTAPDSFVQPNTPGLSLGTNPNEFTSLSQSGPATFNAFGEPQPFKLNDVDTFVNPYVEAQDSDVSIADGQLPTLEQPSNNSVFDPSNEAGNIVGLNSNMSLAFRAQYTRVYNALAGTRFASGAVRPNDGERYGVVTGSRQEWANFFTRLASVESSFNPSVAADINGGRSGPLTSFGLYQMGQAQFDTFGGGNIYDPNDNTNAFVRYAERLYFGGGNYGAGGGTNVITGRSGDQWLGLAAAYGPLQRALTGAQNQNESQLLAENIPASERQTGGYTGGMVMNTDPNGATSILNINNMAKGVFTYPAPGAVLWVFFREGNPLCPVYFAANYGQREWESAFRQGSDAPMIKPAPTSDNPITSTGTVINWGVGGIRVEDTTDPTNVSNNQKSVMLFGHDGSNMFFNDGYHQIYSRLDRRDQVDGSRFQSTFGPKEEIVQSDSNSIVMGDQIIKVGNISPDAVNAMNRIHDIIKDIMKPLSESNPTLVVPFPEIPRDVKGAKYVQDAIDQSKARYKVPEPAPYTIPAKDILDRFAPPKTVPPKTALVNEVPITPPTPPT